MISSALSATLTAKIRRKTHYLRDGFPSDGWFNRYDPFEGVSTDPQSLHKYNYVEADPINGVDPTGYFTIASTLSVGGIRNTLNAGIGYVNTAFRAYNSVQRFLEILDYSKTAIRFLRALTVSTPQGAAVALANELRNQYGIESINQITQGFETVVKQIGPHWNKIQRRLLASVDDIAGQLATRLLPHIPRFTRAEAAGTLRLVLLTPTPPGAFRGGNIIPIGNEAAIHVALGGGRLFGLGIQTVAGQRDFEPLFRIDYFDGRLRPPLNVHYHLFGDGSERHPPGRVIWTP